MHLWRMLRVILIGKITYLATYLLGGLANHTKLEFSKIILSIKNV